ncbi:replication-relaxation family protein [Microbispora amethystogenes]|uniref:Replication-relaxation n=1 Tax=Microbispora amethystogenes TaxID=1427754 RepID=A0ABQ4FN31_9ACTN|nr:replication-relaxation family protein [Microbispora amethystogenes]GIH36230.1 hypothetical protein Mam01_63940 [Microbispora amethystogenes]
MNQHYTPRVLDSLVIRLSDHDRCLLRMVWTHEVLTTHQLLQVAFDNDHTGRHRLVKLNRLGALDRFRPRPPLGSAPWHYVLGEAGAAVLALEDGVTLSEFGYRRGQALSMAYSQRLAHTIGVNGIFAALSGHARRSDGCRLNAWWTEARCKAMWGKHVRPDAYGRWTDNGHTLDFFLEYDTGTETLDRVAAKLRGYASLAAASGIDTPVLFLTSASRREANLHERLRLRGSLMSVPVATATQSQEPHEAIWLPGNRTEGRLRLAELARHFGQQRRP